MKAWSGDSTINSRSAGDALMGLARNAGVSCYSLSGRPTPSIPFNGHSRNYFSDEACQQLRTYC
jgi:hypothetical protein